MRTIRRSLLALACLAAFAFLASPSASASQGSVAKLDTGGARSFWTPERMARAVPLDAPRAELALAEKAARRAAPPYLSEPVPDPSVNPYPAVGKVFFKIDGRPYVCSAAITDAPSRSLVWTAGHCIRDPGRRGDWATKWVFVPGYDQGARPNGSWPAKLIATSRGWIRNNGHFDFGAAVIKRRNGVRIQNAIGSSLPIDTNPAYDQTWQAVGYPEGAAWGQQLWHCVSPLFRIDPFGGSGPDSFGIGCDMTGGSSGGPWIGEGGGIGAVTSYGYRSDPDGLYGTYLGAAAAKLYSKFRNRH